MFEQVSGDGAQVSGNGRIGLFGGAAAGCLALPLVCAGVGLAWLLAEPDTAPEVSYAREIPATDAIVAGIDLEALHRERWTRWTVARSGDERRAAAEAIATTLAPDPGLAQIAGQLLAAAEAGDLSTARDAADVYAAAMAARGMPWGVQVGGSRSVYVKTYWILARPTIRLGGRPAEVRYGLRVDGLNVVEGWLGLAEDIGGAIVVADRVEDFAVDVVWPLLGDEAHPLHEAVRAEAARHLGDDALSVLSGTADRRAAMVQARRAVDDRRYGCDSGFGLRFGWDGVDDLAGLRAWARRDRHAACPGITNDEADAVIAGTLAIRGEAAVPGALERLVAWTARHVAVHEARHRIDQEDWGAGVAPPCARCGPLDDRARVEASAYLSALASEDAVLALVQNCDVIDSEDGGYAVRAIRAVLDGIEVRCDAPPPADLRERAVALAASWFDRAEDVQFGEALPAGVPLSVTRRE